MNRTGRIRVPPAWLALGLAACGGAPAREEAKTDGLTLHGGFAWAPPAGEDAAVYFTITNPTDHPDTLVHVNTPDAAGIGYHRSVTDGGLVRMERLDLLSIPARDSLILAPGGTHVMLTSLKRRNPGDTIHMSFTFARSGTRVLAIPVLAPGEEPARDHSHE